ncbi:protein phosphatase [Streptomyces sp. NPDC059989]|uniref:protein-tyrosine phosphatase family protein n=1 Tax=Streptomyces sp. NPDC059989 TaxID=3347026 RepID=UPI0036AC3832
MAKTRRRDREVPGPPTPWDEVAPGLWMGGHYWTDPAGELRPVIVADEFDVVISLFTRTGHGPGPRAEHVVGEVPDAALNAGQLHTVQRLARTARLALEAGLTTLVRCHSGYNRSGLVVAQCLIDRGMAPAEAIALVRRRRSPWALHNETFTSYLTAGLDVAALLVGLDPRP